MSDTDVAALVAGRYRPKHLRDLEPYAKNSRKHSPAQLELLEKSLVTYGWTRPVMEADGTILAGHGTVLAALALANKGGCPAAWPDPWMVPTVDLSHLDEDQRRAYVILDNKSAETGSTWDREVLSEELGILHESGVDLSEVGFSMKELDKLLADDPTDPRLPDPKHTLNAHTCPACGHQWTEEA